MQIKSDLVYEVQDLITENTSFVHANRLKFYADSSLHVTEELCETITNNSPVYQTVTKLLALRFDKNRQEYQVYLRAKSVHRTPSLNAIGAGFTVAE